MKTSIHSIPLIAALIFSTGISYAQANNTDTIKYNQTNDSNVVEKKKPCDKKHIPAKQHAEKNKPLRFTFSTGLNVSNFLEINATPGPDKKNFSGTGSFDLGLSYKKDGFRLEMTNEAHWLVSIQKAGLSDTSYIQRVTDDLKTLHDFSFGISKGNKLNVNLIAKATTSIFTIYDGDYFENMNHKGKIQAFLSPYELILSPGIKIQPDNYLRISISPYSMSLYGVENQHIANTGRYTYENDGHSNYVRFVYKQLGAGINIWYDRQVDNWLELQYRIGVSSDYFDKIGKNGLLDGLFITKIKLLKDLYLSHRAELKGDFAAKTFKPYYAQTILLSFTKSF